MNFPMIKLTRAGLNAVVEAAYDQKTLMFTGCKLGSGAASNPDFERVTDMTTVEKTLGVTSITVDEHIATMRFVLENSSLQTGFFMRELGIFARLDDGEDEGEEFLYAYTNAGDNAGYVKPYDADNFVSIVFDVIVAVGNAETVDAVISGAVGFVTTAEFNGFIENDFNTHINNFNNPHRVTKTQVGLGNVVNAVPSNYTISFTTPATLQTISSGSKMSVYMGMLARAILSLREHLMDSRNPHQVTPAQIGAATAGHTHAATDITGTLPVSHGGTGVTTLPALKNLVAKERSYVTSLLSASGWSGSAYSLESSYSSSAYDVEIEIAQTATRRERRAFSRASIVGDPAGNVLHALGAAPGIDIPVVIKVMEK